MAPIRRTYIIEDEANCSSAELAFTLKLCSMLLGRKAPLRFPRHLCNAGGGPHILTEGHPVGVAAILLAWQKENGLNETPFNQKVPSVPSGIIEKYASKLIFRGKLAPEFKFSINIVIISLPDLCRRE